MGPENMGGAAAPIINLDDTGLNTRKRLAQAEAPRDLPPPLPLQDFTSETPVSQQAIVADRGAFPSRSRPMFLILAGMLVGVGMIHFTGESEDPMENFATFFRDTFSLSPGEDLSVASNPLPEESAPAPAVEAEVDSGFSPDMVPNPYWMLPNELEKGERSKEPVTPEQAEQYTNGLNHRFTYQRYRTVQEVRAGKKLGSAAYLAKATNEPKFWTRMEGGLGLIEQGYALDTASVERLIGDSRSSLVYNYMQRFAKAPKPSEIYFMKQAIRLVDARTRLHILKILSRDKERHALYFAAAQYDPSPVVSDWLTGRYGEAVVSADVLKNYQSIAMQDLLRRGQEAPAQSEPAEAPAERGAITVRAEEIKIDEEVIEDVTVFDEQDVPKIPTPEEVFSEPEQGSDGFDDLTKLREND